MDYGLGSANENLPAFVVMNSVPSDAPPDQGLLARLWGSGFCRADMGVQLPRPVTPCFISPNPPGMSGNRRAMLDGLRRN